MKNRFNYDVVVKDLFQRDHPSLLDQLTGGVKVREFLNLELAAVEERLADLLILLEDDTILHIDFQSTNDRDMVYREGLYGVMAAWKYKRRVQQVVLYMGAPKMRMSDRIARLALVLVHRLVTDRADLAPGRHLALHEGHGARHRGRHQCQHQSEQGHPGGKALVLAQQRHGARL